MHRPKLKHPLAHALTLAMGLAATAQAVEVTVTVENLSPDNGLFVTPVWVGFHNGGFDTYNLGDPASTGLERLAEDGNTAPLSAEFATAEPDGQDATLTEPGGFAGAPVLDPGRRVSRTFDLDPATQRFFSYATMIIPSNDAFVANADPLAHALFDAAGNFVGPITFTVLGTQVRDAGTEANTETDAAFINQTADNTGTTTADGVSVHPGFNGSVNNPGALPMNILGGTTAAGTTVDTENGDFTRTGFTLLRITVSGPDDKTFNFVLGGNQETPPVDTSASGACMGILHDDQTEFTVNCNHDVAGVTVAHIHEAPPGVGGGIVFPFDDAESPIQQTFAFDAQDVDTLLAGDYYVNVHSEDFTGGEVRGQITAAGNGSHSGSWFSPSRDGEGFNLELVDAEDPTLVLYWYTYAPDGSGDQVWLTGTGPLHLNQGSVQAFLTSGATFGDAFDPDDVERTEWGTVSVTFTSCDTAFVEFESLSQDFGSGSFTVERLTQPLIGQEDDCP